MLNEVKRKRKSVSIKRNSANTKLQFDAGNDITIIYEDTWRKIGNPSLKNIRKLRDVFQGNSDYYWAR